VKRLLVLLGPFASLVLACNEPSSAQVAPKPPEPTAATVTAPSAMPSAAPTSVAPPVSATATAIASAPPAPTPPPPDVPVVVANFGLHIGGGPNDDVTKAPILTSIEPHFPAFRACFAKADDTTKKGDFGVDLLIERDGGKAKVTKPRTAIAGEAFRSCVVSVFEGVDFKKPRGGKTIASYSLLFTPR